MFCSLLSEQKHEISLLGMTGLMIEAVAKVRDRRGSL